MAFERTSADKSSATAAVLFALVFPTFVTLVYFVWLRDQPAAMQQTAFAIGKTLQFGFPAAYVWLNERPSLGFHRPTVRDLGVGFGVGAAIVLVLLVVYVSWLKGALPVSAIAAIRAKLEAFGAQSSPRFFLLALFYSFVHSLLEEYYWRWFVFGRLRRLVPWQAAVLVSALGFAAHHVLVLGYFFGWNSPLTYLFSLAVAVGGALWAWIYQRAGALWTPWVSHLLVDAGIFLVGYDLVFR